MKRNNIKILGLSAVLALIAVFSTNSAKAQCDSIASLCNKHMPKNYLSDGQSYRALLINDQLAEFHVTLYGGATYRVAACSGMNDGNLIFSLYDKDHKLLFTNSNYKNAPYWDFKVTNTINCSIEAHLNTDNLASGCAVLLIGFKQ